MPTASSAQMRRSIAKSTTHMTILNLVLFTFLIARLHNRPVPSSRTAATTKSNRVHLTSSVNCIAIIGISNRRATAETMKLSLLFLIIISVLLSSALKINSVRQLFVLLHCIHRYCFELAGN